MSAEFGRLFHWNGETLEDVRFWCEPELTSKAINQIPNLGFPEFDGIASFEARGFLLAGMAAEQLKLPIVLIRKHKVFYEKMAHERIDFMNWKHESESLSVLKSSLPSVRNVLLIDDILDSGNSLRAGSTLLSRLGIQPIGAFYLLNAGTENALQNFAFPIKSIIKKKLF